MFKVPKHRKFEYKPRYYDAEKEEREKRIKFIQAEARREKEAEESGQSYEYQGFNFKADFESRQMKRNANRRILMIVAILAVICYMILW